MSSPLYFMNPIVDNRIANIAGKWVATCENCNKQSQYSQKNSALKMLSRKSCRYCKRDYRNISDNISIYKKENKWGKTCSGCGREQLYTRKDHAKQSYLSDWQCKSCISDAKKFSNNRPIGDKQRLFNKFKKSAQNRNINWNLTLDEMFLSYTGKCALTGWDIDTAYITQTASLDRINNTKGYSADNVQWVHSMVNMCKNKYDQKDFLKMCKSISENINSPI